MSTPFLYGWVVVALSFLTALVGAGIRSAPTVFIHPLETEFGWSRAQIGFAVSINFFLYGVAAPVSGWLIDRVGAQRVMVGSLACLALGVGSTTLMRDYWHLLLLWGAVAATAEGTVRVAMGDYQYAFLGGGIMAMIAACLALSIHSEPIPPLPPAGAELAHA